MTDLNNDLNAVIANAVNARIEAQVAEALAGDEMIGKYVSAALMQEIEVGVSYNKRKTTFLKNTLDEAIRAATKEAVMRVLAEETDAIEVAVRRELKASVTAIAAQLVGSVSKAVETPYGISIDLKYPIR